MIKKILVYSVPVKTDSLIYKAIDRSFKNRTALIIAHRLDTLRYCDKIIVFGKDGCLDYGEREKILQQYSREIEKHLEH